MSGSYAAETPTREILSALFELARFGALSCAALAEKLYRRELKSLQGVSEQEIKRVAYYAKSRGYLKEVNSRIVLSDTGLKRLGNLKLNDISIPARWDGKWRILSFDIPESKRLARDAVRRLIKRMGFTQLHGSVWVYPHDCSEQIRLIQDAYNVPNHIRLIIATEVDGAGELIVQFKKKRLIN